MRNSFSNVIIKKNEKNYKKTKRIDYTSGHELAETVAPTLARRQLIGSIDAHFQIAKAHLLISSKWCVRFTARHVVRIRCGIHKPRIRRLQAIRYCLIFIFNKQKNDFFQIFFFFCKRIELKLKFL